MISRAVCAISGYHAHTTLGGNTTRTRESLNMLASTWRGGAEFTLDQIPDPEPAEGQVLVEIDTTGICGTDVHITQGLFPSECPKVIGHEASGVIIDVGRGVDRKRIGERVIANGTTPCYECWVCRNWHYGRCPNSDGGPSNGFFAERAAVPSRAAVKMPDDLATELGALTEPAACCLSGVEMLDIPYRATGLVIGAGLMGLFTIAFLKSHGVETLVASEMIPVRREMAAQLGADILHDPAEQPLEELTAELTGDIGGFDITAEAVGKPELVAKCIANTRVRGQSLMIGVSPKGSPLPVDLMDMHYREIKLMGAFGQGSVSHKVPAELLRMNLDGVISGTFPLSRVADGIDASARGEGVKFTISPNMH